MSAVGHPEAPAAGDGTSPLDGLQYTTEQRAAIEAVDGNLQIIAGAGSGKTQVLAARIAEILARKGDEGILPRHVVAFTFTDRAAAELKDRVARLVRERLGSVVGLADMYVGTIHGYCLALLQRHVPEYFKYTVLTDVQSRLVVDRFSRQSGLQSLGLARYKDSERFIDVMSILREATVHWERLDGTPVVGALRTYEDLLQRKRYLDYSSIMFKAIEDIFMPPRSDAITDAGGSVVAYERWLETRDSAMLEAIAAYNRRDCESTLGLSNWLEAMRQRGLPMGSATGAVPPLVAGQVLA